MQSLSTIFSVDFLIVFYFFYFTSKPSIQPTCTEAFSLSKTPFLPSLFAINLENRILVLQETGVETEEIGFRYPASQAGFATF